MNIKSIIAIVLTGIAMQACASGSVPMNDNMTFSVQPASVTSQPNWSKKSVPSSGKSLYVQPKVVLAKSDIVNAIAQKDSLGQPMVILQLTPMARLQLQAATQSANDHSLAVLVNDYVVSIIDGSHSANSASIAILNLPSMELATYIAQHLSN